MIFPEEPNSVLRGRSGRSDSIIFSRIINQFSMHKPVSEASLR